MNIAVVLLLVTSMGSTPAMTGRSQGCMEVSAFKPRAAVAVRDASQWQNPYLVVHPKWIELTTGIARKKQVVQLSSLEGALRSLPAVDWPYGGIVAVQEAGIRSGSKLDDKLISQNEKIVEMILAKLCTKISRWPA